MSLKTQKLAVFNLLRHEREPLSLEKILHKLGSAVSPKEALNEYASSQALQLLEEKDREAFLEDLHEDLKEIDQSRVAGLGISAEQLNNWIRVRSK